MEVDKHKLAEKLKKIAVDLYIFLICLIMGFLDLLAFLSIYFGLIFYKDPLSINLYDIWISVAVILMIQAIMLFGIAKIKIQGYFF